MTHFLSSIVRTMSSLKSGHLLAASWWISITLGTVRPLAAQEQEVTLLTASAASEIAHLERNMINYQRLGKSDYYFVLPPCPVNQYTSGEIIAVPKDGAPVLNATLKKGDTPAGTALFPNGCLVVVDPAQLDVGTYRFAIETADQAGNTATHSLTVKLKPSGKADADAMYAVRPPKALDRYVRGDVLAASQDRDGAIVQSEFVKGQLPAGSILTDDGRVIVEDPAQLQAGQYAAWIATEDEQGGTTLFIITLIL